MPITEPEQDSGRLDFEPRLLNLADIARITGTSERTARRLVEQRALPTVKVGRFVRVRPSDLDDYLQRQTRPAVLPRAR